MRIQDVKAGDKVWLPSGFLADALTDAEITEQSGAHIWTFYVGEKSERGIICLPENFEFQDYEESVIRFKAEDSYVLNSDQNKGIVYTGRCPIKVSYDDLDSVFRSSKVFIDGVERKVTAVERHAVTRGNFQGAPIGLFVKD